MVTQPVHGHVNEKSRSVGFPRSVAASVESAAAASVRTSLRPTHSASSAPLSKRAKGRWFVSVVLCSLLGFVGYNLWNELIQFQAYGELKGEVIRLSTIVPGRISSVEAREGDHVSAGQLLATIDVRELKLERRRLNSELQIAIANLQVRMVEVQATNRRLEADQIDRCIEYYKLLGEYHVKRSQLEELANSFESNRALRDSNSIAEADYVASKAAYEGLQAQVEDLSKATRSVEPILGSTKTDGVASLLQAEQSRIDALKLELDDVDLLIEASQVRAPLAGRILKRLCNVGEYVQPHAPVFELLEAESVEAVLYMPQHCANLLNKGDNISLRVTPLHASRSFTVHRISPEIVPPPAALQSNYRAFKGLVRVHARPEPTSADARPDTSGDASDLSQWLGAEVALPRFFYTGVPSRSPVPRPSTTAGEVH